MSQQGKVGPIQIWDYASPNTTSLGLGKSLYQKKGLDVYHPVVRYDFSSGKNYRSNTTLLMDDTGSLYDESELMIISSSGDYFDVTGTNTKKLINRKAGIISSSHITSSRAQLTQVTSSAGGFYGGTIFGTDLKIYGDVLIAGFITVCTAGGSIGQATLDITNTAKVNAGAVVNGSSFIFLSWASPANGSLYVLADNNGGFTASSTATDFSSIFNWLVINPCP